MDIIHKMNSYSEFSPSGEGIRIFVKGTLPDGVTGRKKGNIEIYQAVRYLTVTGHASKNMPQTIEARQEAINEFYKQIFEAPKPEQPKPNRNNGQHLELEDNVLLEKALSAKNGDKIKRLYDGDCSEYPSQSEADLALCSLLAFWTKDSTQLDRLYRASNLYREKWDEKHYEDGETYGQKTISKALAGSTEHFGDRNGTQRGRVKQKEFWPELISAKDLLATPTDLTRWVWDRTLSVGSCSVLVSKPKVGKSTLAVNIAIHVARGWRFLNRDTQKSGVAYLFLDGTLEEIKEVFEEAGLRAEDPIFVHTGAIPRDSIAWIMQRVEENRVRLVIIDTLQKLFRFKDVNDYSQVINAMNPLIEAAGEKKVHVLFLHHAGKYSADDLDAAIGSTAIRGMAHTYLHEKRLPESERRILRTDQRNGKYSMPETAIGFNKNGLLEVQGSREDIEIEEAEPKILEYLEAEGGVVVEKILLNALEIRAMVVSKALRKMFQAGKVERTGRGKKGNPFRYSVARSLIDSPHKDLPDNSDCRLPGGVGSGEDPDSLPILTLQGRESGQICGKSIQKQGNGLDNTKKILFPENREENGKRIEKNNALPELEGSKWTQEI